MDNFYNGDIELVNCRQFISFHFFLKAMWPIFDTLNGQFVQLISRTGHVARILPLYLHSFAPKGNGQKSLLFILLRECYLLRGRCVSLPDIFYWATGHNTHYELGNETSPPQLNLFSILCMKFPTATHIGFVMMIFLFTRNRGHPVPLLLRYVVIHFHPGGQRFCDWYHKVAQSDLRSGRINGLTSKFDM